MNGTTEHPIFYWHDSPGNRFRVDVGDADEAAECPHCVPVYSAETVDRLRARVAELESQPAELVEIDGHTYGLRPGAARVVREALADDPELDCTDFAKPAWWRGEAYGSSAAIAAVTRILDGKDDGRGVANEPWQSVRTRLREAMRDAGRYRLIRDGSGWPAAFGSAKDPEPLRDFMLDEAIRIAEKHAAMAKDGA